MNQPSQQNGDQTLHGSLQDHGYSIQGSMSTDSGVMGIFEPEVNIKFEPNNEVVTEPEIKIELESEDEKDPLFQISDEVCKQCDAQFSDPQLLKQHIRDVHTLDENDGQSNNNGTGVLKCDICAQKFKYYWALKMHVTKVHESQEIQCSKCPRKFKNQKMLDAHIEIEAANHRQMARSVVLKCNRCEAKYFGFYGLSRHMSAIHQVLIKVQDIFPDGNFPYKCPECASQFTDPHILKGHRRKVHKYQSHRTIKTRTEKNYICDLCGSRSADKFILAKHMRWFHLSGGRVGMQQYRCKVCFTMFPQKCERDEHARDCWIYRQCCKCQKKFPDSAELRKHFTLRHDPAEPMECTNQKRKYECPLCLYKFHKRIHLNEHFEVKDYVEPPLTTKGKVCDDCGEVVVNLQRHKGRSTCKPKPKISCKIKSCNSVFAHVESMERHMKNFHAEGNAETKAFKCTICDALYTSRIPFTLHMKKQHNQEVEVRRAIKSFKCSDCPKSYTTVSALAQHKANPKGKHKTLQCCQCHTLFQNSDDLREHFEASHETLPTEGKSRSKSDRGYRCPYCLKRFQLRSNFKKHFKEPNWTEDVHQLKRNVCDICQKAFERPSRLKNHKMSVHNDTKEIKCEICKKGYSSTPLMERHKRRCHGKLNFNSQKSLEVHMKYHQKSECDSHNSYETARRNEEYQKECNVRQIHHLSDTIEESPMIEEDYEYWEVVYE